MSEYHPSEAPRLDVPLEAPEAGSFDADAADVGGEGDWDLSDLTDGPDLGHCASACIDHDQIQ